MRVAVLQMRAVAGDVEANLARIVRGVSEAAQGGADLMVAPELAVTGYGARDAIRDLAEPADGAQVGRLAVAAEEAGLALIAGFAERDGGSVYNSAALVGPERVPVIYRKSHLYADYERALFTPAEPVACVAEVAGRRVGMLICYDVEFPENVRRLALAGAEVVAVPTALQVGAHAHTIAERMIPIRAFENQLFVAYANLCGRDDAFAYAGLSHVAAPDGGTLALAAEEEGLIFADIRPEDYAASRAENTYLRDLG